ncbi:MAG: nitroreductase [Sphaerobacteraceae bacterium]|nr:MAG: nitroreductase [Sphaerobacteraceae bacterium]
MSDSLNLSADEVLTTTRSVRKRLDFSRPVDPAVIRECLEIAGQAPSASNRQDWHFIFVTEPEKRALLADIYARGAEISYASRDNQDLAVSEDKRRVRESSQYLIKHMAEAPVLFIPCIEGRTDNAPVEKQASRWGTIVPAMWSFMLAARNRGLGTCLTTMHLNLEREAAEVLEIPYDEIMQVGLIPVAYTKGTDFKLAKRQPLDSVMHWEGW